MKNELVDSIEKSIAERDEKEFTQKTDEYFKLPLTETESLGALNWYFRIGLFRQGLKRALTLQESSTLPGFFQIPIARFLNSLGLSFHAIDMVKNNTTENIEDLFFKASIYYTNYHYQEALHTYEKILTLTPNFLQEQPPARVLGYCDTLSATGKADKAFEIAQDLLPRATKDIDIFIIFSACAEYLCVQRSLSLVPVQLEAARKFIVKKEKKIDYALFIKWQGVYFCLNNERDKGLALIKEAISIFQQLGIREEAWFDCMYSLYEFGGIKTDKIIKIMNYPGFPPKLREIWCEKSPILSREYNLPVNQSANLFIDFFANEYRLDGVWHWSLSKELSLLYCVAYAGEQGLSFPKASLSLWPDEPFSYLNFEDRLFKLIKRCKQKYKIEIVVRDQRIYVVEPKAVGYLGEPKLNKPSFLAKNLRFKAKDVSNYYQIKSSQLSQCLNFWIEKGWIKKQGYGPNTSYIKV